MHIWSIQITKVLLVCFLLVAKQLEILCPWKASNWSNELIIVRHSQQYAKVVFLSAQIKGMQSERKRDDARLLTRRLLWRNFYEKKRKNWIISFFLVNYNIVSIGIWFLNEHNQTPPQSFDFVLNLSSTIIWIVIVSE